MNTLKERLSKAAEVGAVLEVRMVDGVTFSMTIVSAHDDYAVFRADFDQDKADDAMIVPYSAIAYVLVADAFKGATPA
jgi:hypothetical protein